MPYQCVRCSRIIDTGNKELLEGCVECHGKFFFYVREEQLQKLKEEQPILELSDKDKSNIEKDVREIAGIEDETIPVILDLESVRILGEGKYEIDVVNLFNKKRPVIYRLEEGKYVIDLASSLSKGVSYEE